MMPFKSIINFKKITGIMTKMDFKIDEIALVVIVVLVSLMVNIYDRHNRPMEADKITEKILSSGLDIANSKLDESKINEMQHMDYRQLKDSLGIKNDFCIYIEDGKGNVILAKGSNRLNGDGIICNE